jgi:hypothetical protein
LGRAKLRGCPKEVLLVLVSAVTGVEHPLASASSFSAWDRLTSLAIRAYSLRIDTRP